MRCIVATAFLKYIILCSLTQRSYLQYSVETQFFFQGNKETLDILEFKIYNLTFYVYLEEKLWYHSLMPYIVTHITILYRKEARFLLYLYTEHWINAQLDLGSSYYWLYLSCRVKYLWFLHMFWRYSMEMMLVCYYFRGNEAT